MSEPALHVVIEFEGRPHVRVEGCPHPRDELRLIEQVRHDWRGVAVDVAKLLDEAFELGSMQIAPDEILPRKPDEAAQRRANTASHFVPPQGKFSRGGEHGPKTLAEIADLGDVGCRWFRWALVAPSVAAIPEYAGAVRDFARVYAAACLPDAGHPGEMGRAA